MTKIERRRAVVKLLNGNHEAELADLLDRTMAAQRAEANGTAKRRAGSRSQSAVLALEYDQKREEAEVLAEVTVWAIRHDVWDELSDAHPPRENEPEDAAIGVNVHTFRRALTPLALVAPDDPAHDGPVESLLDRMTVRGRELLTELDLSRLHFTKVAVAAWNVNVGDDSLPKFSLVSLLKEASEPGSKSQPKAEQAPE